MNERTTTFPASPARLFAAIALASAATLLATAPPASAEEQVVAAAAAPASTPLTGLAIATKSDQASRSDSEHSVLEMVLENSRGQQRVRTIEGFSREITDEEEHRFSRFLEPADVKDTTLLTHDYDDNDDDIWLYLPALKKVKRILSSNKTDYFMGSDFTYEDMENLDLKNWDYKLTGEESVGEIDCYVVEAVANNDNERDETFYSKTVSWIAKSDFLPRKTDFYDKKDRLAKRLILADIHPTSETDPRPRAHKLTMENFVKKHKTVLTLRELNLDVAVDDEIFSQRNMRQ